MAVPNKGAAPSVTVLRSQLGRARGLGSAKSGLGHWWAQRLTAIALLPLSLYFVFTILFMNGATQPEIAAYIGEPWNAVLFTALVLALFYHLELGLRVVIEDYVHGEPGKLITLLVTRGVIALLALASLISVLKLAL